MIEKWPKSSLRQLLNSMTVLQQAVCVAPVHGKEIEGGNKNTEGIEWLPFDPV